MADSFPHGLTAIDDRARGDHWYLRRTDVCHYVGAYTAGKGFGYSATNSLILDSRWRCRLPGAVPRRRGPQVRAGPAWGDKGAS